MQNTIDSRRNSDRAQARAADADRPTVLEMLEQLIDLTAGLSIALLPLLIIAVPGVILLLILPAVLLVAAVAIPGAIVAALLAPPWLLVRFVRRRASAS